MMWFVAYIFFETRNCVNFFQNVIRAVIAVLTNEEQALGLQQPAGIGQRPRPMGELRRTRSYILTADLHIFITAVHLSHTCFSE